MPRILFLHDNFPAQFGAFGQYLARNGWEVWFGTQRKGAALPDVKVFNYAPHRENTKGVHPYAASFERAVLNGQAVVKAVAELKTRGLDPDIVVAHSGWGPGLFVKDVWPNAKFVGYFEWYYRDDAPDVAFLADPSRTIDDRLRALTRNAAILTDLAQCDAGICPTQFQREQFPKCFHERLAVMPDGIDTDYFSPGEPAPAPDLEFLGSHELITYVARGMEPYRGFPEFMQALEIVLRERPDAHAVIVGEDRVAYGRRLAEGDSYKQRALKERTLDWTRVHFTGLLPRPQYRSVLQASSVHVYLTIPFVLSWSLLEAMSAGCAIVASDVASVREVASGEPKPAQLVDMRRPEEVAAAIMGLLSDRTDAKLMGAAARARILERYQARDAWPRKAAWLENVAFERAAPR